MSSRTLAITGATGFIGRAVAAAQAAAGWRVQALVRPASAVKALPAGVERRVADFSDVASLARCLADADALVHCAGAVRGASEAAFRRANVEVLENLVAATRAMPRLERFVHVSSLAAREPEVSPYARSKRDGETVVTRAGEAFPVVVLRPPAVYGPGDREVLPLLRAMARGFAPDWGDSSARFSLLFIDDLVAAIATCLDAPARMRGIYELHDGHADGYSMDELVTVAESVLGRRIVRVPLPGALLGGLAAVNLGLARIFRYEPMLTPWKVRELKYPRWVCDNTPFTSASGWRPGIAFRDGLQLALGRNGRSAGPRV